ncbi:MAG: endonuclease/exonuclease/phosphatase family protein [Myxococcota bacterium]|jgi:endonuclease/exonuclease/phosphatase family metal-dependent hydrolase|nr:endonuclease/exonuclease/phosphatase family protein [Myxococcota bacterium]
MRSAHRILVAVAWTSVACVTPANELTDTSLTASGDEDSETPTQDGETIDRPSWEPVKVATLNVQRFFDTTCDSGTCGPDAFEPVVSADQFEAKARAVSLAIESMDAEFVLLQEIESQACLDAVQARLGGRYTVAVLGEIGVPASVDVAVLAEGTLLEVVLHRQTEIPRPDGGTTLFSRELPEVHVQRAGRRVILMPLHFRSKYNDDPDRRLAEAQAARAIVANVAATYPDAMILLGGDVNDFPGSPPMNALEADDTLDAVYDDLPAHERWTHEYKGQQAMIDHLFIANDSGGQLVAGSTRVLREDGGGLAGSDHAAVIATVAPVIAQ